MRPAAGRWAVGIGLTFLVLAGAIALGLVAWARRDGVLAVHASLVAAEPWLLAWRLLLFSALMIFWREIVESLSRSLALSAAAKAALMEWRWRAGVGIVIMDLILAEDLLLRIQRVLS